LLFNYASNVDMYSSFHAYFRQHSPPALVVWGEHDPFFTRRGAIAYARDLPDVEFHFYNTGHFALETHLKEIASTILDFLDRRGF
jgi:pimeloyl-ACP methyl ester carboxylesterase